MNHEKVVTELLTAFRGRHSARRMGERLGISHNRWARWEAAKSSINWRDFSRICRKLEKPLGRALNEELGYLDDEASGLSLLVWLYPGFSAAQISRQLGASRQTVPRWLSGKTSPDACMIFRAIDQQSYGFLPLLLSRLADVERIPELADIQKKRIRYTALVGDFPSTPSVLALLHTREASGLSVLSARRFLCERTGHNIEVIDHILRGLEKLEMLKRCDGHFVPSSFPNQMHFGGNAQFLLEHWQKILNSYVKKAKRVDHDKLGTRQFLVSVSSKTDRQIRETIVMALRRINSLVRADARERTGKDVVRYLALQLFRL